MKQLAYFILVLISFSVSAQTTNIQVGNVHVGELDMKAFSIKEETKINISGYGASYREWGSNLVFYGWILNSKSRNLVWSLKDEMNEEYSDNDSDDKFHFEQSITLPKGTYEVYYAGGIDSKGKGKHIEINSLGDLIDLIAAEIRNEQVEYHEHYGPKLSMSLSTDTDKIELLNPREQVDKYANNAILSLIRTRDNTYVKKYFRVVNPTEVNIYSVGERLGQKPYDYLRIVNTYTMKQVWPNSSTDYKHAGGGKKNQSIFQTIKLDKGDYTIYYVSDDSHSFRKWNVFPPYDPQFWGATVWTSKKEKSNIEILNENESCVFTIDRVRDNRYYKQGFELCSPTKIKVLSLGERMNDDEMADYGWIIDAENGEMVWEFQEWRSEHAGGARKNRIAYTELDLDKGKYVVYYTTDGSHAYGSWNSAPPTAQDLWGISLMVSNPKDKEKFKLIDAEEVKRKDLVVDLTRIRDNERISKDFELEKDSKIRILSIGEGDEDEMFDTGWIKDNDNNQVVWEMTFRNSRHAGGDSKNRKFDGVILLPKGNYTVYFQTDGSHSYRDWNATPPHQQELYGVSIFKKKE